VAGPCAFEHTGSFACEALGDDFYVSATRKAARGALLTIYINVERYQGPGDYKTGEMYVGVQDKTAIHRWSSYTVDVTVGPEESFVVLRRARLEAEPLFVDCFGSVTDLHCTRRETSEAFNATVAFASGTLQCEPHAKKVQ
jgi:hypothetical protein